MIVDNSSVIITIIITHTFVVTVYVYRVITKISSTFWTLDGVNLIQQRRNGNICKARHQHDLAASNGYCRQLFTTTYIEPLIEGRVARYMRENGLHQLPHPTLRANCRCTSFPPDG